LGAAPAFATVTIQSITPSVASPQPLGTPVTWTVTAVDSDPNNLTFQFSVAAGSNPYTLVRDYNIGTLSAGVWTAQPFVWSSIQGEGNYSVQVIAKDFITGATDTKTAAFQLTKRVSGSAVVNKTGNALVALFSAPGCAKGSNMRVAFYTGSNPPNYTSWAPCNAPVSMNFYVAGMLPSTTYSMYSQTETSGKIAKGMTRNFTTGALPARVPAGLFPGFTVNTPASSTDPNPMILWGFTKLVVPVATDLNGNIMWYYGTGGGTLLTRLLPGGTMLTIQNGRSWDSSNTTQQLLREIDLSGNIVHETNTGVISNQILAMGLPDAKDATPCGQLASPHVGDGCLNDFHHEAIRYTINGQPYTAFMAHLEKLFPAGTQGHTGSPVDILSEMVIVLNSNWQVVWYYDAFSQLDIARTAPLNEVCGAGTSDCPTNLFLSKSANDWTHANSINYVAAGPTQNPDYGDFLVSMRNQDQVIKINYNGGRGNCAPTFNCIGWYMGPPDGLTVPPNSFSLLNTTGDPWPWFSHQHDVTYANGGKPVTIDGPTGSITGPLLTIFDNGNTRYSAPPLGLGSSCGPSDCNSRGMAYIVNEAAMQAIPVFLQDLGVKATALGSAQLLMNTTPYNFAFGTGLNSLKPAQAIEIAPAAGSSTGTVVLNLQGSSYAYRAWQMPNLYNPPTL